MTDNNIDNNEIVLMKFFAKAKKCEQVHNNKTLNKIFPNFNGIIFESLFAMILNTALKRFRQLLLYTLILFNTHLGWAVTGKVSRYSDSCLESLKQGDASDILTSVFDSTELSQIKGLQRNIEKGLAAGKYLEVIEIPHTQFFLQSLIDKLSIIPVPSNFQKGRLVRNELLDKYKSYLASGKALLYKDYILFAYQFAELATLLISEDDFTPDQLHSQYYADKIWNQVVLKNPTRPLWMRFGDGSRPDINNHYIYLFWLTSKPESYDLMPSHVTNSPFGVLDHDRLHAVEQMERREDYMKDHHLSDKDLAQLEKDFKLSFSQLVNRYNGQIHLQNALHDLYFTLTHEGIGAYYLVETQDNFYACLVLKRLNISTFKYQFPELETVIDKTLLNYNTINVKSGYGEKSKLLGANPKEQLLQAYDILVNWIIENENNKSKPLAH